MPEENPYPPIADYGYIADCHSAALVSRSGSIDWCCMPRYDSPSCFGRILDWKKGGYCQVTPSVAHEVTRQYSDRTLVLETRFKSGDGEVRLLDCMTMRPGGEHHPHRQILRVIEGLAGRMELEVDVAPVFDYGAVKPWIQQRKDHFIALGGGNGLLVSSDLELQMKHRHHLEGKWRIEKGQRAHLSVLWRPPEELDEGGVEPPDKAEQEHRLEETIAWWENWANQGHVAGRYGKQVQRSAIILKGLTYSPTGAIAAAATTSLPEYIGGQRNWDYRFSWIRDSYFTVRSLATLGYVKEADGFRRFIERTVAGSAEEVQVLFGLGGERRLYEYELENLEGYRQSRPVRVGNAAEHQRQLDVCGELLGLAWLWHKQGCSPDDDYWEFLVSLVNSAARDWIYPDQGLWEMRGAPRHFVQSKVMCWSALDRGLRLARELEREAPLELWEDERDKVRRAIEERGYDDRRGVFIQAFNYPLMDSALLLLPTTGFVDYRDERMVRTTDAVRKELAEEGGLLRRYASDRCDDGLQGSEGVFCCCSFWLAECLAHQGRRDDARAIFDSALQTGNDLGIFAEEYDPRNRQMLGNLPQGLTHLSLIAAAAAIDGVDGHRDGTKTDGGICPT
ncbi:MAG: glycoside hydrolase family 15 protein [Desulfobacterales bacterium]